MVVPLRCFATETRVLHIYRQLFLRQRDPPWSPGNEVTARDIKGISLMCWAGVSA